MTGKSYQVEGQIPLGKGHHASFQVGTERLGEDDFYEDGVYYVSERGRSSSLYLALGFTTAFANDRAYLGAAYGASLHRVDRLVREHKYRAQPIEQENNQTVVQPEFTVSAGYRGSGIGLKAEYSQYRQWGLMLFFAI